MLYQNWIWHCVKCAYTRTHIMPNRFLGSSQIGSILVEHCILYKQFSRFDDVLKTNIATLNCLNSKPGPK